MRIKQVKEYSNRQRITLNKKDGLSDGEEVVILTKREYEFKEKVHNNKIEDLQNKINGYLMQIDLLKKDIDRLTIENDLLNNQQNNLQQIIKDVIEPVQEQHKIDLEVKENEIKQLKMDNESLKNKSNQLCIDIMDLSALQLIFTDKKKVLIDDFNKSISFVINDATITDTDAKKIEEPKK